jgi:flavin-dependent dehydrogenase
VSASRRLRSVYAGNVALIGDASGSVDAITGEGLCLSFKQATMLAEALTAGDLQPYQAAHRQLARRPALMADLMLSLDLSTRLRSRAIRALSAAPRIFERMLAMHVGELSPLEFAGSGAALAWRMLSV